MDGSFQIVHVDSFAHKLQVSPNSGSCSYSVPTVVAISVQKMLQSSCQQEGNLIALQSASHVRAVPMS